MLMSYHSAVNNPRTELVHLFEILEALQKKFSINGKKMNQSDLSQLLEIDKRSISDFGYICNNGALRQGRHSGRQYENLKSATQAELDKARTIACKLIEGYFNFLEKQTNTSNDG